MKAVLSIQTSIHSVGGLACVKPCGRQICNHRYLQVEELRTVDISFNKVIDGTYLFNSLDEIPVFLEMLPKPNANQYYMLSADALTHELPDEKYGLTLLGYDLSDWTSTSTLTNCCEWTDALAEIASSVNKFGLLDLERAKRAQRLLPELWNHSDHSQVTIWAVFELPLIHSVS
jgi:hypothetical protein